MSRVQTIQFENIVEGQSMPIKARIVSDGGVMLTSDGLLSTVLATGVDVKVYDLDDTPPRTAKNATSTVAVATAFVAAATGYLTSGWKTDSTGYNFAVVIPNGTGALFTVDWQGGHDYRIEVQITSGATIQPGSQAEGPIAFIGTVHVDYANSQT